MKTFVAVCFVGLLFVIGYGRAWSQAGALDTSFNTETDGWIYDMALTVGGDIFIAGIFTQVNGVPRPQLARLIQETI